MINIRENRLEDVYLSLLDIGLSQKKSASESRIGEMIDLGPTVFELAPGKIQLLDLNARAINPYLAVVEAAWILSGSQTLKPLQFVASVFNKFSDDGSTLHGAYGHRLRHHTGVDLIDKAIQGLRTNPTSRRIVLPIYSSSDVSAQSNDVPCNISIMMRIIDDALDFTVINRSNDLIYGVPYNCFSFSLLHYYIAAKIGVSVGTQRHFSNCMHIYVKNREFAAKILDAGPIGLSIAQPNPSEFMSSIFNNAQTITELAFDQVNDVHLKTWLMDFRKSRDNETPWTPTCDNGWLTNLARIYHAHKPNTSVTHA